MDVEPDASDGRVTRTIVAPIGSARGGGRLLGDAAVLAALLLTASAAADPTAPGVSQLKRLLTLMNQVPDAGTDGAAASLRRVYQAVGELRQVVDAPAPRPADVRRTGRSAAPPRG